jgi:hypothetical protein
MQEEHSKRRAAEQKVRQLQVQAAMAADQRQPDYSVRIAGAELGPIIAWALVIGGGWAAYTYRDVLMGGAGRASRGRWVYDRSMGGKKVGSRPRLRVVCRAACRGRCKGGRFSGCPPAGRLGQGRGRHPGACQRLPAPAGLRACMHAGAC